METTKDRQFWTTEVCNGMADLTIISDASTSGWGTSCGTSQTGGGGGAWTIEEAQAHINLLELPSPSDICIPVEQPTYSVVNRQSHSHSLSQSQRWHNVNSTLQPGSGDLGMVSAEESDNPCGAHSRETKQSSRSRISLEFRLQRLEIRFKSVHCSDAENRSLRCRSIRCKAQCTTEEILQLLPGSSSGSYRRPITNLGTVNPVRLSSICTDRPSSPEDTTRSSGPPGSTNRSSMALPAMVPSSVGESDGLSDPTTSKSHTFDQSKGGISSSDQSKQPPTSCLESFR